MAQHLQRAQRQRLQNAMQALDYLQRRLVQPAQQLQRQTRQLNQLLQAQRSGRIENLAQHLVLLDPKQVLVRGYSLVQDAGGGVVSDAGQVAVGAELRITFAQGWARAEVKERG